MSATQDRRRAEGRCIACGCSKLPGWHWTSQRCPDCAVVANKRTRRWRKQNRAAAAAGARQRNREVYQLNRELGLCACGEKAKPGRTRCHECTSYAAYLERERQRRIREAACQPA